MKKNWLKGVLCLVMALTMLAGSALAVIAEGDVAADAEKNATISVSDGKLTVTVTGQAAGEQYALLLVKPSGLTGTYDSASALLTAAKTAAQAGTSPYSVDEDQILYIDQAADASGMVTFGPFLPMAETNALFVLSNKSSGARIIGAMIGHGVTVSGTVTAKEGTNGATSVTVAAGDISETVTLTDGAGSYTLAGVATEVTSLSVSAEGNKFVAREYAIDASANVTQNVVLLAKGDVVGNGDGVKINDVAALFSHQTKVTPITDAYVLQVADVVGNGDGVKINDVAALFAHQTKVTPLW